MAFKSTSILVERIAHKKYTTFSTTHLSPTTCAKSRKAQSSMELLILMGFLTFVIIGILGIGYFYSNTINDRIKSNQINSFANKITTTSETVFYAGEPSKSTISTYLPENVQDIEIIDNTIVITYNLATGQNKIAFPSNVPIAENPSAQITPTSGLKNIVIIANQTHAIISQN
ncbi:hypothetical protein KAT36_03760 [Candidatus Pacearchaeota archaeon]|nr:hypothetical protein [Candidatus Pacearchaeota archaeon]